MHLLMTLPLQQMSLHVQPGSVEKGTQLICFSFSPFPCAWTLLTSEFGVQQWIWDDFPYVQTENINLKTELCHIKDSQKIVILWDKQLKKTTHPLQNQVGGCVDISPTRCCHPEDMVCSQCLCHTSTTGGSALVSISCASKGELSLKSW